MFVALIIMGALMVAFFIMILIEAWHAPLMPQSWQEDTGEYVKCDDCEWDDPNKQHGYGMHGPGCMNCPFFNRKDS